MSKYKQLVWLNPVVENMVKNKYPDLLSKLHAHQYQAVKGADDVSQDILKCYGELVSNTKLRPVIDSRCPRVIKLILDNFPQLAANLAPIDSILISRAKALYDREVKPDSGWTRLTIVTPCTDLVNHGENVFGEKLRFVTWNEFAQEIGFAEYPKIETSPIPLGFFDPLEIAVLKASGELQIRQLLALCTNNEENEPARADLLELLYCPDGCHNGDGL